MGIVVQGPWKPLAVANLSKLHIARELGVSRKTIERWMKAGMPYARDYRGFARFNLQAVLRWLDERDERTG